MKQNTTYSKRWATRNPEKRKAHRAIDYALKSGKLMRPHICDNCGCWNGWHGQKIKIDAHHLDYSQPLDVTWLCKTCHSDETWRD